MKSTISGLLLFWIAISTLSAQFPPSDMDPVSWSFKKTEKADGLYDLKFSATIQDPWHVYAISQEKTGPIPTNFHFNEDGNFILEGKLTELSKPVIKFDEGFQFNVGAYYKKAEFVQSVRIKTAGEIRITGYVEYQCCNDETCLPPFQKEFSFRLKGSELTTSGQVTGEKVETVATENEKNEVQNLVLSTEKEEASVQSEDSLQNQAGEEIIEYSAGTNETQSAGRSMAGFLLVTFLLGLAAILTPCVYPMIPMTISFFMRGEQKRSLVVLKGIVFGLSMIMVYTGLGVLVALTGLDANFGNVLSTHWIPNSIFFILFMIFAASFLGMFEMVLPSGFVNKVDKQADKGGLIGPFFMGITTVLVSFSCTGPIVGSLLTEAAGGEVMKPILGMFFFSLAFALPFTFLAIFPSMLKNLPKSGGWMNTVKVVLGLLMFAFGMKFLSSMDQSYHLGIFTREIYLAIWFVLAVILGFYLLGKIKFAHDSEISHLSVPRLMFAVASFVFAIYIFTGILGNDLQSVSSFIPPKSSQHFTIGGKVSGQDLSGLQNTSDEEPVRYGDIFHLPYGLKGYFHFEDGLKAAREKQKPVFIDFTGHSCSNCKQMEAKVWSDPAVLKKLKEDFVIISLYTDDKTRLPESEWITNSEGKVLKTIGEVNVQLELEKFGTFATPWYVILDSDGRLLTDPIGKELNIGKFIAFLDRGLEGFRK